MLIPTRERISRKEQAKYSRPLACPPKGSALRPGLEGNGYRSLVAMGGPIQASIAPASAGTMEWVVEESGHLGRLILMGDGETTEVAVTAVTHNNDPLVYGSVPFSMFEAGSFFNPVFGHWAEVKDSLKVSFLNNDVAAVKVIAGWTAL